MKIRAAALAIVAAALLAGCGEHPVSVSPTDNVNIKVDRLFDHDGCTVYRFIDGGVRYFVKCRDGTTRAEWDETYPCGKSVCSRTVSIPGG